MRSLSACTVGTTVTIHSVTAAKPLKRRLLELGFVLGARCTVLQYAPLKDPIVVSLGEARISLRRSEAACILVEQKSQKELT